MSGATDGQQRLWDRLRVELQPQTARHLAQQSDMSRPSVQWILRSWVEQGHVRVHGTGSSVKYEIIGGDRKDAPIPTKGARTTLPNETAATHLWNAARGLKSGWTPNGLRAHSPIAGEISDEQLRNFVNLLMRSGYLRCLSKAKVGREAKYRLTRNTGPLPPEERRVRLTFDPNLGEISHMPEMTS